MSKRTPSGAAALHSLECSSKDKGLEAKAIDHNIAVYPECKSSLVLPLKTFDINAGPPKDTRLTCFSVVKRAHTRDGEKKLTHEGDRFTFIELNISGSSLFSSRRC